GLYSGPSRPRGEQADCGTVARLSVGAQALRLGMGPILHDDIQVGLYLHPIRRGVTTNRDSVGLAAVLVKPIHCQPARGILFVASDEVETRRVDANRISQRRS